MERLAGLTLAELLVVLAVLALLSMLAVPALDAAVLNAKRRATIEALVRGAWLARVEAARRGRPAVLCASADGTACAPPGADWSGGWIVAFPDEPPDVLRRWPGAGDARARVLSNRNEFVFQPFERRSTNGTLAWCDRRGAVAARAVVVATTGRPRVESGSGSLPCPAGG